MVQIIDENRYAKPSFARSVVGGLAEGAPEALRNFQENRAIQRNYGLDLTGVTDPTTRQQLIADQLKFGRSLRQAQATQGINYGPNGSSQNQVRPSQQERQEFVNENRPSKMSFPGFQGAPEQRQQVQQQEPSAFGHTPQTETQGKKYPLMAPPQIEAESARVQQEENAAGLPTTRDEAREKVLRRNQQMADYNAQVDADISQQVETQNKYGGIALEKLEKLFPEGKDEKGNDLPVLTDEMRAIAQGWGEEIARDPKFNTSEASINKELARRAIHFKNIYSQARNSKMAPRLMESAKQDVLGTNRKWDSLRDDYRLKLKPLLNEGLFDTARNILSEKDFGPEEREAIITDLGENAKKQIHRMPSFQKAESEKYKEFKKYAVFEDEFPTKLEGNSPEDRQVIKDTLRNILNEDPSANLILLRKGFGQKNVDWTTFKDVFNELALAGEIKINPDQFKHLNLLDEPPLDNLDKMTYGLNIIGR